MSARPRHTVPRQDHSMMPHLVLWRVTCAGAGAAGQRAFHGSGGRPQAVAAAAAAAVAAAQPLPRGLAEPSSPAPGSGSSPSRARLPATIAAEQCRWNSAAAAAAAAQQCQRSKQAARGGGCRGGEAGASIKCHGISDGISGGGDSDSGGGGGGGCSRSALRQVISRTAASG
jgi:hypothetical protein